MKIKKSATTKTITIVKEEEEEEEKLRVGVKVEYEGVVKQEIGIRVVRTKREKRLKAEAKDEEGNDEGESVEEVGTTAAKTEKREKSERGIKTEIKEEKVGDNHSGVKSIATGRGERVENINRASKRILKFEDKEVDIKLEEAGMTMADRIKRRRR